MLFIHPREFDPFLRQSLTIPEIFWLKPFLSQVTCPATVPRKFVLIALVPPSSVQVLRHGWSSKRVSENAYFLNFLRAKLRRAMNWTSSTLYNNLICDCKICCVRHINREITAKSTFQLHIIGKKSIQPWIIENSDVICTQSWERIMIFLNLVLPEEWFKSYEGKFYSWN